MTYSREYLFGQWFSSGLDEDGCLVTEYCQFLPDGSFEMTFIEHDSAGEIVEQIVQLGDWGLVGDIHFTMTKSEFIDNEHLASDLANADNYHAYKVLSLDQHAFRYQHIVSKEVFNLRRVADKIGHC